VIELMVQAKQVSRENLAPLRVMSFADHDDVISINVSNSTFFDNRTAITLFGDESLPELVRNRFALDGNTIKGSQPSQEVTSVGIIVGSGAQGRVKGNMIIDHSSNLAIVANDRQFLERGFFYPLKSIAISGNVFSNNAVHLAAIAANNIVVTNNTFGKKAQALRDWGITITGTNLLVADNNFADMPQGIALPAGELLQGFSRGSVLNVKLANNWFTNVATPIYTNTAVRGLMQTGTKLCCFAPEFATWDLTPAGFVHARLRSWHYDVMVFESSTDLKQWSAFRTNVLALPILDVPITDARTGHEFFRLRKNP
jgi:hypothetical protein